MPVFQAGHMSSILICCFISRGRITDMQHPSKMSDAGSSPVLGIFWIKDVDSIRRKEMQK